MKSIDDQYRIEWKLKHAGDLTVHRWIENNPPPAEWLETALDWAFLEMPDPDTWFGAELLKKQGYTL